MPRTVEEAREEEEAAREEEAPAARDLKGEEAAPKGEDVHGCLCTAALTR